MSWSVGVQPLRIAVKGSQLPGQPHVLGVEKFKTAKPAIMQVEPVEDGSDASATATIVDLFRADMLHGIVEVTGDGIIMAARACPFSFSGGATGCS
jgi:hypothetical protein